nr:RNA-binding protein [uncultured Achromobacter sp.]
MAELLINHVADDTSDEDVRAFLVKYGFPSFDHIERIAGDLSRPAVLVTFNGTGPAQLRALLPRIHGVFWQGHTITALVMRAPIP